jgi:hypothetical protein
MITIVSEVQGQLVSAIAHLVENRQGRDLTIHILFSGKLKNDELYLHSPIFLHDFCQAIKIKLQ